MDPIQSRIDELAAQMAQPQSKHEQGPIQVALKALRALASDCAKEQSIDRHRESLEGLITALSTHAAAAPQGGSLMWKQNLEAELDKLKVDLGITSARDAALARARKSPFWAHMSNDARNFRQAGDLDTAYEIDTLSLANEHVRDRAQFIVNDWLKVNQPDRALELGLLAGENSPDVALKIHEHLVEQGRWKDAARFADAVIDRWVKNPVKAKQSEEDTSRQRLQEATSRLELGMSAASPQRFGQLYSDYQANLGDREPSADAIDYKERAHLIHLGDTADTTDPTRFLLYRTYVAPELLERYGLSTPELTAALSKLMGDAMRAHPELRKLFTAIALHAAENPHFRLDIKDGIVDKSSSKKGGYQPGKNRLHLREFLGDTRNFIGTLTHEWTHQLMQIIYASSCAPYRTSESRASYQDALAATQALIDSQPPKEDERGDYFKAHNSLFRVTDEYGRSKHHAEFIVRYPQALAEECLGSAQAQGLYLPLSRYWAERVEPDIDAFIEARQELHTFELPASEDAPEIDPVKGLLDAAGRDAKSVYAYLVLDKMHYLPPKIQQACIRRLCEEPGPPTHAVLMMDTRLEAGRRDEAVSYARMILELDTENLQWLFPYLEKKGARDILDDAVQQMRDAAPQRQSVVQRIRGLFRRRD